MIVVGLFVGVFARREHYLRIDWCAEGSSVGIDVKQWNVNILGAAADCTCVPSILLPPGDRAEAHNQREGDHRWRQSCVYASMTERRAHARIGVGALC